MTSDNVIIKVLSKRSNFFKYKPHLQWSVLLENTVQIITDMEVWFNLNPEVDEISWDDFSEWFRIVLHPALSDAESKMYSIQFERIKEIQTTKLNDEIFRNLIERKCARDLITLGSEVCSGKNNILNAKQIFSECDLALEKLNRQATETDPDRVTDDIVELLSEVYGDDSTGLDWPLEEMNISLGPLRKGDSVLIAAYVDTGKTLLTVNCCRAFLNQLPDNEQIIYFSNEEAGKNVKYRFIQSVLGRTGKELSNDFTKTMEDYNHVVGDPSRFVVYHNGVMTIQYIEEKLAKHNPGVIVIDQLHNVGGFEKLSSTTTERMTELAKWTRRLAQLAPCIFTHQADGQCNGVKFIEMHQLYGSKVGMQGAVDAVITLGKENGNIHTELERGLYFPKNKLLGGRRCEDDKRKYRWNINILPHIARFKGNV